MNNYVGIDISKCDFHVCFNENKDILKFNNDNNGISSFLKYLKTMNRTFFKILPSTLFRLIVQQPS